MLTACVIALGLLLSAVDSAPVKVPADPVILFHGEDFHMPLPSLLVEVTFQNRSAPRSPEVVLMRGGNALSNRARLNGPQRLLVVETVGEGDEGTYTVKNPDKQEPIRRFALIVRDCPNEQNIKYGDNFHMQLFGVPPPITFMYRPSALEANQTSRPALVLLTSTAEPREGYQGRISVTERHITLSAVTGADEGSYTVRDEKGEFERKVCLNVREHQTFEKLPLGATLKINLILNSSLVQVFYIPDRDPTPRLLLDKGELTDAQSELGIEDRVSLDGSLLILENIKASDVGQFKTSDILNFPISTVYLEIQPYQLESLYVAIIALLGLVAFLLLACLVSCLIKVKKRAKRAAALEKLAENAGKEDEGEAFRQVVKNITKMSEDSKHSQADTTEKSQSTEVDIKGLEVSSKEVGIGNLDTSDSGVGFNTTALPLDTDTDAADLNPDSEAVSISAAPETKPSAPPALEVQPTAVAETKTSPAAEPKKSPDPPAESKLDVPKVAEVKPSSDPKPGLSPVSTLSPSAGQEAKTPEPPVPSPSPEPKSSPKPTPSPAETKKALAPTPELTKATTPEPITNGTPEPDSKPGQDLDVIGSSAPKAAAPKAPEVELKEATAAEESTTT